MKKRLYKLLIIAVLFVFNLGFIATGSADAESSATLTANQQGQFIVVTGKTASDDPDKVPLLITDDAGQAIYFQDVLGRGSSFAFEFEPPKDASNGTAMATLYSTNPVTYSFKIRNSKPDAKMEVSISIIGYQGDEILPKEKVTVGSDSSAFRLLTAAAEDHELEIEYKDDDEDGHDIYIQSIDGLAEFDKGPGSGWIYRVNGKVPDAPVDRYLLDPGDDVEFIYTSDYGNSEGGTTPSVSRASYSKTESVSVDNAISRLQFADNPDTILGIVKDLLFDLASYDLDKQRTYVPDVALFFQAAYERAATLSVGTSKNANASTIDNVELMGRDVDSFLEAQGEVLKGLHAQLEQSVLYKNLLSQLKPTLVVALPEETDTTTWKVTIPVDVWRKLNKANANLSVVRKDWRTDLYLDKQDSSEPRSYTVGFYSDQEQTAQLQEFPADISVVPMTPSYRIKSFKEGAARIEITMPLTGTLEDGAWPVLYTRKDDKSVWSATSSFVKVSKDKATCMVTASGDFLIGSGGRVFFDVRDAAASMAWVKEPVTALSAVGVVRGMSPTQFGPYSKVTRNEFSTMLSRIDANSTSTSTSESIGQHPITREEIALLLAQSIDITAGKLEDLPFSDKKKITVSHLHAVALAVGKGWLKGRSDGRFDPQGYLTRAEAAAVLFRYWKDKYEHGQE